MLPLALPLEYTLPPVRMNASCTLLVGVFSAKVAGRAYVRQTWGRDVADDICLWFIVGKTAAASNVSSAALMDEYAAHGDILLLHGHSESYGSLPWKSLSFYAAAVRSSLRSLTHLLKTDDDVFVNLPAVRRVLPLLERQQCYVGYVYGGIEPDRNRQGKYRDHVYERRHMAQAAHGGGSGSSSTGTNDTVIRYPPFVDGIGELMSVDVASCIARQLPTYEVPSTLADVVTGHAASALCSVLPCSGRRSGCLLLPGHLHAAWPLLPEGEQTLFVRHSDRSIVLDRYRGRLRFLLRSN